MSRAALLFRLYLLAAVAVGIGAGLAGLAWPWILVAAVLVPPTLVVLPRFVAGVVRGGFTPRPAELDRWAEMSGTEFEDYVARVARSCGVPVIMTSVSGDFGVDLIVGHRPNRLAVQCKRRSRPVGPDAVQEVVAGAPVHDCTRTMVVTNHEFTAAARTLAEQHGCVLVGRDELPRLRSTIRRLMRDEARQAPRASPPPPHRARPR
ncbi:restriction endonuclease [uncultured Mycolicibacterium sp.]|uniref:restriction endonuclease n=1 Tax=uncultured Mycolicibacterium sp. TaxID=2320817 RepID=UPI00260B3C71|nr:restriction endonuclease [uncultured Mycolicibacterium sp.]